MPFFSCDIFSCAFFPGVIFSYTRCREVLGGGGDHAQKMRFRVNPQKYGNPGGLVTDMGIGGDRYRG